MTDTTSPLGSPNPEATHWSISRLGAGRPEKLQHPNGEGVGVYEWPHDELTADTIRDRWGAGTYKTHFVRVDPDAEDPRERRRVVNQGPVIKIEAEPVRTIAAPASFAAPAPATDMASALQFATSLMAMSDQRAKATIDAVAAMAGARPAAGVGDASVLAEIAALKTRIDADARQREIEDRHRAELAERDRQIADLRRDLDAEPAEDDRPMFEPGAGSMWQQVAYGFANAAAKMSPDALARIVAVATPLLERFTAPAEAPAAPSSPPRAQALPVAPLPRRFDPPPPAAPLAEPPTANGMPSVPMPKTTSNGIPVTPAAEAPAVAAPLPA